MTIAAFLKDGSITPESRDCSNRFKRDGANSEAQFNNREAGIPSGPAEFVQITNYVLLYVKPDYNGQ